jgi:hypothetical protein
MKTTGILFLLFISVCCSAQTKDRICTIDITAESKTQIKVKVAAMPVIEKCIIIGQAPDKTLDEVLGLLEKRNDIESIQFENNDFELAPKKLEKISNLKTKQN